MPRVFVYGAQMAHPESVGAAWPARVEGHAVRFVARGIPIFEPVFAALEPAVGEVAYGVIVEFDDATWAELVRLERGYALTEIEAELLEPDDATAAELGAARLRCTAFSIRPRQRAAREGRPSSRYARKLAAGARAHGLPAQVVTRYERAVAQGSRASLALSWLFPLASRIGLAATAILITAVISAAIAGLAWWLSC